MVIVGIGKDDHLPFAKVTVIRVIGEGWDTGVIWNTITDTAYAVILEILWIKIYNVFEYTIIRIFRCKNIFVRGKCTKIISKSIIT